MNKRGFLGKLMILGFIILVALAFYLIAKMSPDNEIVKSSTQNKNYDAKISSASTLQDTNLSNKTVSSNINKTNSSDTNQTNSTNSYRIIEEIP